MVDWALVWSIALGVVVGVMLACCGLVVLGLAVRIVAVVLGGVFRWLFAKPTGPTAREVEREFAWKMRKRPDED